MAEQPLINKTEVLRFLSDPESISEHDLEALRNLTLQYPFSQALHFAYVSGLSRYQPNEYEKYLQKAVTYSPSRNILKTFISAPATLRKTEIKAKKDVLQDRSAISSPQISVPVIIPDSSDAAEAITVEELPEPSIQQVVLAEPEVGASEVHEPTIEEFPDFPSDEPNDILSSEDIEALVEEEPVEIVELRDATIAEEADPIEEIADLGVPFMPVPQAVPVNATISDEIETVIPYGEVPFTEEDIENHQELEPEPEVSEDSVAEPLVNSVPERFPEEQQMIVGSIASSDYFVFDKSVVDPLKSEIKEEKPAIFPVPVVEAPKEEPAEDLTKYHDDTLPYTFLWWLHKTRKEHADTYQPYIVRSQSSLKKDVDAALNQQIIENIFHIQPELNTFPQNVLANSVQFELKKKEDEIIEKFIKEEPQIRPPQIAKLDTENKARKSSEDNLDLVSETLAKIYIDQMLYHKAIDTYKKLSLKFPDKKLYFAGQISDLEKKIN